MGGLPTMPATSTPAANPIGGRLEQIGNLLGGTGPDAVTATATWPAQRADLAAAAASRDGYVQRS
jgi:hypothetical protein